MRRRGLSVLLMLVVPAHVVWGGRAVSAQPCDKIVVNVPFAFVAGNTRLAAGDYVVRLTSETGNVLSIERVRGRESVLVLTEASIAEPAQEPHLVFERVDNEHVLVRFVRGGHEVSRDVTPRARSANSIAARQY